MCALGHSGHTDKSAPCPLYPQSRRWLNALFGIVLDTVDRAVDGDSAFWRCGNHHVETETPPNWPGEEDGGVQFAFNLPGGRNIVTHGHYYNHRPYYRHHIAIDDMGVA